MNMNLGNIRNTKTKVNYWSKIRELFSQILLFFIANLVLIATILLNSEDKAGLIQAIRIVFGKNEKFIVKFINKFSEIIEAVKMDIYNTEYAHVKKETGRILDFTRYLTEAAAKEFNHDLAKKYVTGNLYNQYDLFEAFFRFKLEYFKLTGRMEMLYHNSEAFYWKVRTGLHLTLYWKSHKHGEYTPFMQEKIYTYFFLHFRHLLENAPQEKYDFFSKYCIKNISKDDRLYVFWELLRKRYIYNGKNEIISNVNLQNKFKDNEYFFFLNTISLDKKFIDKMDTQSSSFSYGGWVDFVDPVSLEFRGIYELYHFVMLKLLLVFGFLLSIAAFAIFKCNNSTYIAVFNDESDNGLGFNLSGFEYSVKMGSMLKKRADESIFALSMEDSEDLETETSDHEYEYTALKNILNTKSGLSKINSIFMPVTYWVYFSTLEFIWTIIPCVILLFISIPSFTLALALDETHKPSVWVKVIGNQWYWIYEYSTYDENVVIYSNILYGSDLEFNSLRLLKPDLNITIINNKFTRFLVTSSDVIHSWAVPALGIKIDACPGRINSISILPTREGVFYGQCSEICGVNHAFMPIAVEVIS